MSKIMPNILDLEFYDDSRALRTFDVFPLLDGQVTISRILPNTFSGWHLHKLQTDFFHVVSGELTLHTINEVNCYVKYNLKEGDHQTISIPPDVIHSYTSSQKGAILVYYLTRKHDENDEFRIDNSSIIDKYGVNVL